MRTACYKSGGLYPATLDLLAINMLNFDKCAQIEFVLKLLYFWHFILSDRIRHEHASHTFTLTFYSYFREKILRTFGRNILFYISSFIQVMLFRLEIYVYMKTSFIFYHQIIHSHQKMQLTSFIHWPTSKNTCNKMENEQEPKNADK